MTSYDIAGQAAMRYKNNKRDQAIFIEGARHVLAMLYGAPLNLVMGEICEYFDQPLKQHHHADNK